MKAVENGVLGKSRRINIGKEMVQKVYKLKYLDARRSEGGNVVKQVNERRCKSGRFYSVIKTSFLSKKK